MDSFNPATAVSGGVLDSIVKPTMLLDRKRAQSNIARMAAKARRSGVRFRPHFKTHQAAVIGDWFRTEGVEQITVSSVDMAAYFAANGWRDITVAFPVNLRQITAINQLAAQVRLHLLVDSVESVRGLSAQLRAPVGVWIEIDAGYRRSGVPWNDGSRLHAVADAVTSSPLLALQGLLTHDGGTYAARSAAQVQANSQETVGRLDRARNWLMEYGFLGLELSVGDTPACSILAEFPGVEEVRPGNFVFYDYMQLRIGACRADEIAVVAACPVVGKYPERQELVLYGGAVHLSKDFLLEADGSPSFGVPALLSEGGWGEPLAGTWLRSLSQEHGILRTDPNAWEILRQLEVGDLVAVYPIHSCLTADLLKHYLTWEGEWIDMAPIP